MLDRMRSRAWGLSSRLVASYILVTLAVVVLVEALVLGFQVPQLVNGVQVQTQLQAQVDATAQSYGQQLFERYPGGVPAGTVLGDRGQPTLPGQARPAPDGSLLLVPAITGPIHSDQAITAVVVVAADGTVVASSAPYRYPPGVAAATELPAPAAQAITGGRIKAGDMSTPYGSVLWTIWSAGRAGTGRPSASAPGLAASVYLQAPWSAPRFINPIRAWSELGQHGETSAALLSAPSALLIVTVPVGVLFGRLATRRLVRRVRRLERATLAVTDGDYTVALPASGRDEIGRLEANFTTMARQLGSALAAERQRATRDARDAERARIAREIHDAISQHLFGVRMIAAGMRRADPGNQEAQALERISEEALHDMQALLIELRSASLDGAGLAPALRQICAAYHHRLGVSVNASLEDVTVPAPVEHALLRIAQEACVNAVRHGKARHLTVSLARQDGHVELAVRDTGTGFEPTAPHAGSGLAHIRDRAGELGGTVDIDSAPGRGAALTVRVPVP
ncbi:HAMP domain-containing protein [Actinocrinis puniceicyclus]|uniref:Oxygen sensor histidine kinase NreB n=1 Tax=Actinocrinis puniceicyclus TaxID=977794 RepID=A0A8J7WL18_9ACTN|nr:HAMP domain-containing protein [Actinocrinis puniceicyclus]MBS2962067.1 HAMP domain-containing protein [Actinocrinis puniceicyclus]